MAHGLSQREAAKLLGISAVHLCNIEFGKSSPSIDLMNRFRDLWRVDIYVLAWAKFTDLSDLPVSMLGSALILSRAFDMQFSEIEQEVSA